MPFYTWKCCKCLHCIEVLTKSDDKKDRDCPKCKDKMERQLPLIARPVGNDVDGGLGGKWQFGGQKEIEKSDDYGNITAKEAMYNKTQEVIKQDKLELEAAKKYERKKKKKKKKKNDNI